MAVAKKMQKFAEKSSWIRKMFEEGARLKAEFGEKNVFDFSLGNPDVAPPWQFYQTLREVVEDDLPGSHGYMPNGGYPFVREALASRLSEEQGVSMEGGDILMSCGAAGGLNVVMKALLDPGDEVIILAPFFVEYNFYVDNHGGVTRVVKTDEQFNLDLDAIEEALTEKTKAVLVNSPNNPTGQVYSGESLQALGRLLDHAGEKFCRAIYLIADEPYRKIIFDGGEVPSIMKTTTNSIVVSSYSKDISLAGERIGYVAVHPDIHEKKVLIDSLTLANRILGFVNAPALMQRVVAELQGVSVDSGIYEKRREVFCQVLEQAGFDFVKPRGAFYLFPKTPLDDARFCSILQEEKILAVPGRGFGTPGYIRLTFCVDESVIIRSKEGFRRAMAKASRL